MLQRVTCQFNHCVAEVKEGNKAGSVEAVRKAPSEYVGEVRGMRHKSDWQTQSQEAELVSSSVWGRVWKDRFGRTWL